MEKKIPLSVAEEASRNYSKALITLIRIFSKDCYEANKAEKVFKNILDYTMSTLIQSFCEKVG